LPDCVVVAAGNGQSALELACSQFFDAVITDIRMPIMDGLRFIERMKEISPATKIVILSGYRQFDYAQKAIQLGAFDYLLKPINEMTVGLLLRKLEDSIQKEKAQSMELELIRKQRDDNMKVYYEKLLWEWLQSEVTSKKKQELQQRFQIGPIGLVMLIKIDAMDSESSAADRIRTDMPGMLESSIIAGGRVFSFFSPQDRRIMITIMSGEDSHGLVDAGTIVSLQTYSRRIIDTCGMHPIVAVGGIHADLLANVGQSFKEALEAIQFRYFLDAKDVLWFNRIADRIVPLQYDFIEEEESFRENIRLAKYDAIVRLADELFSRVLENGLPYPEQWRKSIVHFMVHIAAVIKDFTNQEDYRRILAEAEARLSACEDFQACREEFLQTLGGFMAVIAGSRSKKHAHIVQRCVQYLEEHYMDDLSLDTVANRLFFTPNYLSNLFKSHLGVSFTKYLSDIRLKKAAAMLDSYELKIYEIASKVGYRDEKYFYRVFKARFGITPDEYRKKHALESRRG